MPEHSDPRLVARVGKPHGLTGELTVRLHTDDPGRRLAPGCVLATEPSQRGPLTIRSVRVHHGRYLLAVEGVADRAGAEALRGTRLLSDPAVGEQDDDGDDGYYEDDLVGMSVLLPSGAVVGTVSALHTRPAQDLLEVRARDGSTALVPFVTALVPVVDPARREVHIDPPPGLLATDA